MVIRASDGIERRSGDVAIDHALTVECDDFDCVARFISVSGRGLDGAAAPLLGNVDTRAKVREIGDRHAVHIRKN